MKSTILLTATIALITAGTYAGENQTTSPSLTVLSATSAAELPAKAAALVAQSDAKNLKATTIDVVKASVGLNPAAAPAIVGSIAQSSPSMAATAAGTAVSLVPNQVLLIANAAATAAPLQAGAIVEAMCHAYPANYQLIAQTVSEAVPGSAREVLKGIAAAIPQYKDAINEALAANNPSVSSTLSRPAFLQPIAAATVASVTPPSMPQGPTVTPPPTPPSVPPVVITPSSGGAIPSGGSRGYSAP